MIPGNQARWRVFTTAVLVLGITGLHFWTQLARPYDHTFYEGLYFVPIILAGFWFGLRGALITTASIAVFYGVFILKHWRGLSEEDFRRIMAVAHYFVVALILGILKDRESAQQKRALEAERLAAVGTAMSALAHDMKTPLIAIGGFSRQVLAKAQKVFQAPSDAQALAREAQDKLSIVVRETQRLENMVKDVLDFSRPMELNRSLEDIRRILEESMAVVSAAAAERKTAICHQTPGHLPPVPLDPTRMKQVFVNLLMNAVQASPEGEEVAIRCALSGHWLVVDVIDHGCGIPQGKREEVFSPFYTTKKEGTGLGLPIVKRIVEAHNGRLEILDNPEKGLTFRVVLPAG